MRLYWMSATDNELLKGNNETEISIQLVLFDGIIDLIYCLDECIALASRQQT